MSAELLQPHNCPDEAWEYLSKQYVQHDNGTYTVETNTLNHLLLSEKILWALMQKGVHQWEGFDDAMELAQLEEDEE